MPSPALLIAKKRDGGQHTREEIFDLIESFQEGRLADYQMTAWLMAVYLRGLNDEETLALTEAMLHSGKVRKKPHSGKPRIDKHSTGGVGDKISLPLAPIAATCGLEVPMVAGRGLGHTGGTLDKLESIPGYRTTLSERELGRVCQQIGAAIVGPTNEIAPADRRIYALRDVTATVACRPLIVASILSKKLAAGLQGLVLDVKVGRGAFMTDKRQARQLARSLVSVANQLGTKTIARLTRMEEPLGTTIGNALEVKESIAILRGEGPADTTKITIALAEEMLLLGKVASTRREARQLAFGAIESGQALERFRKMVELQGGDPRVVDNPSLLPSTKARLSVVADRKGTVHGIDSLQLAELSLALGAGRRRAEDPVDYAVGIELHVSVGDEVSKGDRLATLHVRRKKTEYENLARGAFHLKSARIERPPLLLERIA